MNLSAVRVLIYNGLFTLSSFSSFTLGSSPFRLGSIVFSQTGHLLRLMSMGSSWKPQRLHFFIIHPLYSAEVFGGRLVFKWYRWLAHPITLPCPFGLPSRSSCNAPSASHRSNLSLYTSIGSERWRSFNLSHASS